MDLRGERVTLSELRHAYLTSDGLVARDNSFGRGQI